MLCPFSRLRVLNINIILYHAAEFKLTAERESARSPERLPHTNKTTNKMKGEIKSSFYDYILSMEQSDKTDCDEPI